MGKGMILLLFLCSVPSLIRKPTLQWWNPTLPRLANLFLLSALEKSWLRIRRSKSLPCLIQAENPLKALRLSPYRSAGNSVERGDVLGPRKPSALDSNFRTGSCTGCWAWALQGPAC